MAKNPEFQKLAEALAVDHAKIMKQLHPLEQQAAKLREEADKAEQAWRDVRAKIVAVENASGLREISQKRAQLARMGASVSIAAEPGAMGVQVAGVKPAKK